MSAVTQLRVALVAALTASAGDLLMLYVANAPRSELGLPPPAPFVLSVGALLGVAGIPLYALGYRAVGGRLAASSPRAARLVWTAGAGAAATGAFIHGLTALLIHGEARSGGAARSPLEAVATWGGVPLVAWCVAAVLALVASAAILRVGISRASGLPRWWAWLNPAIATLVVAAPGMASELGRSFLVPAAPNLGHAVFFGCSLVAFRAGVPIQVTSRRRPDSTS
jgi:hypothetical protein